jgi:hypothetical protein
LFAVAFVFIQSLSTTPLATESAEALAILPLKPSVE